MFVIVVALDNSYWDDGIARVIGPFPTEDDAKLYYLDHSLFNRCACYVEVETPKEGNT